MTARPPEAVDTLGPQEEREIRRVLLRMRAQSVGIALGLLCGFGLLVATVLLILQGGEDVGAHLRLLGAYFPGYRVTFAGSVIGFVYGAIVGYAVGFTMAWLYNRLVDD